MNCMKSSFLAFGAVLLVTAQAGENPSNFEIVSLSNRADLVSGGDALLEVRVPKSVALNMVRLSLNGHDVTGAFAANAAARTLRGVVGGLVEGRNDFAAGESQGGREARLVITNHPIGGPVLLGSQTTPWICATPTPTAASGNTPASNASGLTTFAIDAQCNIATEYKLFYRTTTAGCSSALPDPSPRAVPPANACFKPYTVGTAPADLATTTTTAGVTVPYIVRVERGTLNRGIYDIAVLFNPTSATPWTALTPQPQWNGKVVYTFGASTGQPRLQFRSEQNWADDAALSRGFMVADNSLTDSLFNSNRVLNAETLMMMKEHIVDAYGEIKYLLGNGCSGGSIQQNTAASIFPGLLDGIQPSCDFPDSITTGLEVTDCVLLVNFYAGPEWTSLMTGLTQAQINAKKAAINGHLDQVGCQSWNNAFGFNNKPGNYARTLVANQTTLSLVTLVESRNNCLLPAALVYDPVTNPHGTRCGDADLSAAVWGTTAGIPAGSIRARQTGDNVGIQYGLKAVLAGAITPEEFVTLNEKIGGFDADWNRRAERTAAKETLNSVRRQAEVILGKPAAAVDFCFLTGDTNFTTPVTDMALCDADPRLPKHASPRQVAGGPLAENILKCELKPLNPVDYAPLAFSSAQLGRLHAVFPDGVCDWDEAGVGQRPAASPLTFADGPGGKRLSPPPVSHPRSGHGLDHDDDDNARDHHDRDDD